MGSIATLTAYLYITQRSASPLARAVVMYCSSSTSSMLVRMIRVIVAVPAAPTTTTGTHRCLSRSHAFARLHGAY